MGLFGNGSRSFSTDHYIRLFLVFYETCQWSTNNICSILYYMFSKKSSFQQRRKWFFDIIVEERIGREEFLNKLLKNGSEDLFDQFVSFFQQSSSDIHERRWMYKSLLQCAISPHRQCVKRVLQWIEKRFTNEQLMVIENFVRNLSSYDNRFQLEYLPDNFETIEAIMDLAFNHLQRTATTLETILTYGLFLLVRAENSPQKIQEFACKIIKRYYSPSITFPGDYILVPKARHLFANILVSDIFPKLVSKYLVSEINIYVVQQNCNQHLISLLLKPRSTRLERARRLLNEIDQIFFLHSDVQRALLGSRQDRLVIDKLLNTDRLTREETNTCF